MKIKRFSSNYVVGMSVGLVVLTALLGISSFATAKNLQLNIGAFQETMGMYYMNSDFEQEFR